jgi:hypothetical protein
VCYVLQVIGREREVARVMQILARRTKNNPILLGEPGAQQHAAAAAAAVKPATQQQAGSSTWHKQPQRHASQSASQQQASSCRWLCRWHHQHLQCFSGRHAWVAKTERVEGLQGQLVEWSSHDDFAV